MTSRVVVLMPRPASAETYKAMARARHAEAVDALNAGDRDKWWSLLCDAKALDEQAARARRQKEAIAAQIRERRGYAAALERILEKAGENQ